MEKERHEEEISITSISLLSAIQSKLEEPVSSCIYVETEVRGKKL